MLPERDLALLDDVRRYARNAIDFTAGMSYEQFTASAVTVAAVLHCLTVIGEAAGKLGVAAKAELPQFNWQGMHSMRHVLVHDYGRTNFRKVWDVVQNELPPLRDGLTTYLSQFES